MINKNNVKIAEIGYGYWGPNLVRNFSALTNIEIVYVCDLREELLKKVKKSYPSISVTTNYDKILQDTSVDAVIIATPTSTHYSLAKKALLAGKHVWIEKPMTDSTEQAEDLVKIAKQKKRILHVDHVFLYTPAVQTIKKIIESGKIGKIYYFDSVRINLGLFQPDTSVIWDLATHDISIMCYLLGQKPDNVTVFSNDHVERKLVDTAHLNFELPKRISAHIHVSWLSPVKIRRTLIAGSKKMIVYDDLETTEKVKIYDYGVKKQTKNEFKLTTSNYQYRTGEIVIPGILNKEALLIEASQFVEAINSNSQTLTDGINGLQVVSVLEGAEKSLRNGGEKIIL